MPGAFTRYAGGVAGSLVGLLLVLTACTSEAETDPDAAGSTTDTPSASPSPSPGASETGGPPARSLTGGTMAKPARVVATRRILDWKPVPGPVSATVTSSGDWTLSVNEDATEATLEGAQDNATVSTQPRERISDAFIDGKYAVVVKQDRQESRPATAVVLGLDRLAEDLGTIDGSSTVPTTSGGTWAMGQGHLVHATVHEGSYCTATVDLATRTSELGWCAPDRRGFNGARITPAGDSLLTFDDGRPACRTVVEVTRSSVSPFTGVRGCNAWEGLRLDDGAVWSVIPKERQIENAHLYARSGDDYYDLGPRHVGHPDLVRRLRRTSCGTRSATVTRRRLLRWDVERGLERRLRDRRGPGVPHVATLRRRRPHRHRADRGRATSRSMARLR